MGLDEYIQSGETIYCQTEASKPNTRKGDLAVTDTRLVHYREFILSDTRILDIDIARIEEIEYKKAPIGYLSLFAAGILVVATAIFWFISPALLEFFEDPSERLFVSFYSFLFALVFVLSALYRQETLIIRTPSDSHKFVGGEFGDFPHAIRGNK